MATAGRILIIGKGAWLAETTYDQLDLVSHDGRAWLAKKTSIGIEPSDANAEFWHVLLGLDVVAVEDLEYVGAEVTYGTDVIGEMYGYKNAAIKKLVGSVSVAPTATSSALAVATVSAGLYPEYVVPFVAYNETSGSYTHGYIGTDGVVYLQILEDAVGQTNTYRIGFCY